MGGMDKNPIVKFDMRADAEFLRKLDELRRREIDIPSRAQMVRRLVDAAFRAHAGGKTLVSSDT